MRAGRMIIVVDDEDRENEGDLTLAAEKVTPEAINFMAKFGRGLVCLAMTEERLEHLRIGPMTAENTSQYGTAFCEAIDARSGVTTGSIRWTITWTITGIRPTEGDDAVLDNRVENKLSVRAVGIRILAALILAVLMMRATVAFAAGTVNVLYAGSLVNLMEHSIGPAFDKATGDTFQGFAGGSGLLANQIKGKLRHGDVFISAVPKVNAALMGSANGDWVSWYVGFAQSPLVIGYNPSSKFAADFRSKPWYQVLAEPGIRIGRTDPKLDPKGALTLELMKQAETTYKMPDLSQQVLGEPENPAQVLL